MTKLPIFIGIAGLLAVLAVGLYVTDFTAYLGNNPATCNNCHVMDAAYEGWYHSSHRTWANCNDCHTPHSLVPKYLVKAQSGYHHVTTFIFGNIPDAIRAKETSKEVVQENCIRCHTATVDNINDIHTINTQPDSGRYCFECHRSVAHGERGITISPYSEAMK